jgi:hypothetical protein
MRAEDPEPPYAEPSLYLALVFFQELQSVHPSITSKTPFSLIFEALELSTF